MQVLQNSFLRQWNGTSILQTIHIPNWVKQLVWWWTHPSNLRESIPIVPPSPEVVTSDASQGGWGPHYLDQVAQGQWHFRAQGIVSNILELRAAFQALLAVAPLLEGKSVLIRMDNK